MDSDFQTILNALPVGILVFGEDERIPYAGRPAERLFGKNARRTERPHVR